MKRILAVVVAVLVGALPALAQTTEPAVEIVDINGSRYPEGGFTTMVVEFRNLPTAPDPGLLQITANGEPVSDLEIQFLADAPVPVGVVLAIDTSGSMSGAALNQAKAAATSFINQSRPGDQIAIVTFADEVIVNTGFTSSTDDLVQRIAGIQAAGETAFNDAVIKGIELFEAPSASDLLPNMIVLTDGEDTVSTASLAEAGDKVADSEVRVFGVALSSADFNPDPVAQVAAAGNGLFLSTPDPGSLSALYEEISREISNTLVVRFVSPIATPGDVEFAVSYEGLSGSQVYAVSGYATTTTAAPAATTPTTLAPLTTLKAATELPANYESYLNTLKSVAGWGLALTLFLLLVILFGREEDEERSKFAQRLQAYGRRGKGVAEEKGSFLERIPLLNRFTQAAEEEVRRRGLLSGINSALEQANIPMTPGEAILAMFGLAAVGGLLAALFNGALAGLATFGVLLLIFVFLVNFAGKREKKKFEDQLPDTLTLLSTSIRAGYSLLQAVEAVAGEAPNPTAREFGRAISEARLGISVPDALQGIVERTQSTDFEWAVMAIDIQREVGGNLAEVLQTVADTMRARNRLKGEIRALTAEGRISAIVLGLLPFAVAGFLAVNNPTYLEPLLTSTFGQIAIGIGLLLMAAGIWWLKKIVDIEI